MNVKHFRAEDHSSVGKDHGEQEMPTHIQHTAVGKYRFVPLLGKLFVLQSI